MLVVKKTIEVVCIFYNEISKKKNQQDHITNCIFNIDLQRN